VQSLAELLCLSSAWLLSIFPSLVCRMVVVAVFACWKLSQSPVGSVGGSSIPKIGVVSWFACDPSRVAYGRFYLCVRRMYVLPE
jgi:hypothetical protein